MAHQAKAFAVKPALLSSIPGTTVVGENLELSFEHSRTTACASANEYKEFLKNI